MKKAFSLVETMIAIAIISLGFTAIISIGLSAYSNTAYSKTKLKAQTYAQGILETYRAERDQNGIAGFATPTSGGSMTIDGTVFTPSVRVYKLPDTTSAIVETTVRWTYKKPESIMSYVLLSNTNSRMATVGSGYSTPAWYPTSTPTRTPTPIPCGGNMQICCAGNTCNAGLTCYPASGTCESFPTATPTDIATATNTPTPTPTVGVCGGNMQPCCAGNTCNVGLICFVGILCFSF